MLLMPTPAAHACSRSTSTSSCGISPSWLLLGSATPGTLSSTAITCSAASFSRSCSGPCTFTWMGWRKPPKMVGVPVMLARTPGMPISRPRSASWISSCDRARSARGFSFTKMRPELDEPRNPPPMDM